MSIINIYNDEHTFPIYYRNAPSGPFLLFYFNRG